MRGVRYMLKQAPTGSVSNSDRSLNVAHINLCTVSEGPRKRMAIWFQGCDILCDGCCNPGLQPIKPAHLMSADSIVKVAQKAMTEHGIEGVTFLGGEPTLQKDLVYLSRELKKLGLGVILFTGRSFEELDKTLVSFTDLIVDGRFDKEQPDPDRNLIGSKNQKVHLVTDRYKHDMDWFYLPRNLIVEVNMGNGSDILFTGDVF